MGFFLPLRIIEARHSRGATTLAAARKGALPCVSGAGRATVKGAATGAAATTHECGWESSAGQTTGNTRSTRSTRSTGDFDKR